MKLVVQLQEARNLKLPDRQVYVQLRLGSSKKRSAASPLGAKDPYWFENLTFDVDELGAELRIFVWCIDRLSDIFLGCVRLPIASVLNADGQTLSASWYALQKRHSKSNTSVTGEIRAGFSLAGRTPSSPRTLLSYQSSDASSISSVTSTPERSYHPPGGSPLQSISTASSSSEIPNVAQSLNPPSLLNNFVAWISSKVLVPTATSNGIETSLLGTYDEVADKSSDEEEEAISPSFFEDDGVQVPLSEADMPPPLGGILLSGTYMMSAKALNGLLFKPGSEVLKDLIELQNSSNLVEGHWKRGDNGLPKRAVTYTKAATKLVKSVKATEEQMYSRADESGFVVDVTALTPDVPYGSTFQIKIQYCIFSRPSTSLGENMCVLRVSWGVHFVASTMMKGFIESGARTGLQDSFRQFQQVLEKYAKPQQADSQKSSDSNMADVEEPDVKNDWQLAKEYFCNLRVGITMLSLCIVFLHIYQPRSFPERELEFWRLDLPDSVLEFTIAALMGVQVHLLIGNARKFVEERIKRGSHSRVRAKGNGWLLAITLIEAQDLPSSNGTSVPDPFAVVTCSGKTRSSSVKLQKSNPQWEERFEFDAMEEAPSTMKVEVFDFEGPFTEAESVGHAEINFLVQTSDELADLWVPLKAKDGRPLQSKVHLKIALVNTKEGSTAVHYIEKVEKEVGWKIPTRTFVKNASFQKLFSLPSAEFLVNDFSCSLKRKILLQGRLFLSPRVLTFYSNIFGHKTKFVLLWEDIEDITETSPTFGSVINPTFLVFTKKGRAMDACEVGARSVDEYGRSRFQFQSFIHYKLAFRTVKALWKYRTLSLEQRMEMISEIEQRDDASETIHSEGDASGTFLGVDEAKLVEVHARQLPLSVDCMLLMYEEESLDESIAEKSGWLEYSATPWEYTGDYVKQRRLTFKLSKQISSFGTNVTCLQQMTQQEDAHVFYLDEVLTLHDVPFGDNFQIRVRKEIEDISSSPPASSCKVLVGVAWQKSTLFQGSISKNIFDRFTKHLRDVIDVSVREILQYTFETCAPQNAMG